MLQVGFLCASITDHLVPNVNLQFEIIIFVIGKEKREIGREE